MNQINFYSFHKGIQPHRFDHNNSEALFNEISKHSEIVRYELTGDGSSEYRGIPIDHGSILIFEDDSTKQFKVYDFGDHPYLTVKLSKLTKFAGAIIGQYNPKFWDKIHENKFIRRTINPSIYPESVWELGVYNYDEVQEIRQTTKLDNRLHWRGSLYNVGVPSNYLGVRKTLEFLPSKLSSSQFHFGNSPLPFEQYIQEAINFKLALSIGGGGGAICGDFCLRDIEMFGLGIPLLRPKYIVETHDPLLPNYHYISVDAEFDEDFKYSKPELLSKMIAQRYLEVIENDEFLDFVSKNARKWYLDNISYPNITNNLIKLLDL
jgi:hypothetical protein